MVLDELLNKYFPCSNGSNSTIANNTHNVVNKAWLGCAPQCHLNKWIENHDVFVSTNWNLIIVEPTTTGGVGGAQEMNELKALVAALATLETSQNSSIILLSASFRLKEPHPMVYKDIPGIEFAVSNLADQWGVPFVSFPKWIFDNGLYNASNHQAHCLEARCNYWVDQVHVTKTSHNIIAKLILDSITTYSPSILLIDGNVESRTNLNIDGDVRLTLPQRPKITIDGLDLAVKKLLPKIPVV